MGAKSQPTPSKRGPVIQLVNPFFRLAIPAVATVALFASGTEPILRSTWLKFLAAFAVFMTVKGIPVFLAGLNSYLSGCTPPVRYPHSDPILGIDFFRGALKALKANTGIEYFHGKLDTVGTTFGYTALGVPTILSIEPENMKAVLQTNFEDWPIAGPRRETLVPLLGDGNIFQSNGKQWQHARAMIRPSFVRDQIADLNCFNRHISNMINQLPKDGTTVDLQKLFFMMTMDSSSDFILGQCTNVLTTGDPKTTAFNEAFDYALLVSATRGRLGKLSALVPDRKFDASVKIVRDYVAEYVQKAIDLQRSNPAKAASAERKYVFLNEMLKTDMPQDYICDQVLGIFLAGRDTTAAALSALFWILARRPELFDRLRREVTDTPDPDSIPTWEELKNMTYLQHCIKEVLRLYPPVPTNSRGAARDTILPAGGGPEGKDPIYVRKGTIFRWLPYSLHRDKSVYGEDADDFNPDRWDTIRPTWEYLPFNGGPRICPGQQFAITQISLVVVKMLRAFKGMEARDERPMLQRVSTTASLVNGVFVGVVPA